VSATDIEKALTINRDGEQVQEWLEVGNGCICCSVKYVGAHLRDCPLTILKRFGCQRD
jgi:G3E family GTPase